MPGLAVSSIATSLAFWCGTLGFAVAYDRPTARFAYLTRGAAQVMLCQRNGSWEPAALEPPFGRGVNLQITVEAIAPLVAALARADWPLYQDAAETWYRAGAEEVGQRELLVQDPDGYLLRFAEMLGVRISGSAGPD